MANLILDDICVRFGGLQALTDVAFTVSEGEVVGLIGPNGAGKTTVFNVITGVYKASAGSVSYDGTIVTGLRPYQVLSMGIARTFQNIRLFQNMTALENCMVQHSRSRSGVVGAILRSPGQKREEARIIEKSQGGGGGGGGKRPTRWLPTCLTATSGGWRSPAPWRANPRPFSWTNRRPV